GYRASGVMLTTEAPQTPPHVNRDITIRGNRFESERPVAILLQDAENVIITDNDFIGGSGIEQQNSDNIAIHGNRQTRQ
ncbi:MAG: right-handed parallel beta-helix repeat-containing protein, partial [Bacteroidaceae bacterium]|nr:right-handed parallel beta-helix repeat-containing protein [Bacteroidaceae bacterium]